MRTSGRDLAKMSGYSKLLLVSTGEVIHLKVMPSSSYLGPELVVIYTLLITSIEITLVFGMHGLCRAYCVIFALYSSHS